MFTVEHVGSPVFEVIYRCLYLQNVLYGSVNESSVFRDTILRSLEDVVFSL